MKWFDFCIGQGGIMKYGNRIWNCKDLNEDIDIVDNIKWCLKFCIAGFMLIQRKRKCFWWNTELCKWNILLTHLTLLHATFSCFLSWNFILQIRCESTKDIKRITMVWLHNREKEVSEVLLLLENSMKYVGWIPKEVF